MMSDNRLDHWDRGPDLDKDRAGFGFVWVTRPPTAAPATAAPIPRVCRSARRLTILREDMSASFKG